MLWRGNDRRRGGEQRQPQSQEDSRRTEYRSNHRRCLGFLEHAYAADSAVEMSMPKAALCVFLSGKGPWSRRLRALAQAVVGGTNTAS